MNKVKKNFIYNLIYQILILILPLITAPYLSRVVGADGVGTYSYTYSIVYYFMLLTLLGVNNYGNRTIAKSRDNKKELSKNFWGIYFFQLFMGIIMLILYLGYVFLFDNEYKTIALIQTLFIISSILDISWFFFGLEEFKTTISRNSIVKIFTVVLIFIFVKSSEDLWKYTLIMAGMTTLGQLIFWIFLKGKINFVKINFKDIKQHIKPNIILFVPVIAVSLYKIMDKIMLGALTEVSEVGYYENAEKIVNIPITIISSLGTVMLPKMSNMITKGEKDKAKVYITKSISFEMFISFAMCFGLIAVGYNFAPFYFGEEFQKAGILIMLLAITLPFMSFANVIRTQYLIPKEKDKDYIISVSLGALINLIMNTIFIPKYGSIGACFGTIAAEAIVAIYQTISVRNELNIMEYLKKSVPFLFKAGIMFIVVYLLNYIEMSSILRFICQIILGVSIYGLLNIKYILSIIDLKSILNKIFNKEKTIKT